MTCCGAKTLWKRGTGRVTPPLHGQMVSLLGRNAQLPEVGDKTYGASRCSAVHIRRFTQQGFESSEAGGRDVKKAVGQRDATKFKHGRWVRPQTIQNPARGSNPTRRDYGCSQVGQCLDGRCLKRNFVGVYGTPADDRTEKTYQCGEIRVVSRPLIPDHDPWQFHEKATKIGTRCLLGIPV